MVTPLIGGIAVIIVFLSLLLSFLPLPISSALLFLGRLIIDFSVFLMEKAAALPGVVVRLPAPTVWQTVAYFLILICVFAADSASLALDRHFSGALTTVLFPGLVRYKSITAFRLGLTVLDSSQGNGLSGGLSRERLHGH